MIVYNGLKMHAENGSELALIVLFGDPAVDDLVEDVREAVRGLGVDGLWVDEDPLEEENGVEVRFAAPTCDENGVMAVTSVYAALCKALEEQIRKGFLCIRVSVYLGEDEEDFFVDENGEEYNSEYVRLDVFGERLSAGSGDAEG